MSEQEYSLDHEHDRVGLTGGYGGSTGVGEAGIDPAAEETSRGTDDSDFELRPERVAEQDGAGGG